MFVEYAKAGPNDILMQVTVYNRGPEPAALHVLPQLWFRNTWSWTGAGVKPELTVAANGAIEAQHAKLGVYFLFSEGEPRLLFCDNETNVVRLYGQANARGYFKDAFHDAIVHGNDAAVNPQQQGTQAPPWTIRNNGPRRRQRPLALAAVPWQQRPSVRRL